MTGAHPAGPRSFDDHALARHLADAAGADLLRVRESGLTGRELKDAGDRASHDLLVRLLAESRPDDAVLSEEGQDVGDRASARRVWIVDPLDGTREFSEPPREDWAVHVALWEDGALVAGAVAEPAAGRTHGTDRPSHVTGAGPATPRVAVSRSRPPAFVTALAEHLGAELVPLGSAGVKAMSVVRDVSDVYVHAGGQYEWDSAAPVAVARASGLHTSRADGSPLVYNRQDPWLPDVLVCRPELAAVVTAFVAGQDLG